MKPLNALNILAIGSAAAALPHELAKSAPDVQKEERSTPSAASEILGIISISLYAFWRAIRFMGRTLIGYLRHHPFHAVLNLIFLIGLALVIVTGSEMHKQLILTRISDQTIEKIIQGSQFTREFNSVSANRDGSREFFRVGAPKWIQKESIRAILFHARKAGLSIEDQVVLLATADIESGFNPLARASTTTACGLFQFVQRTGEAYSLSQEECMDPWLNARSGVEHYMQNLDQRVRPKVENLEGVERAFRTFELSYYLHHDGPNSSNPDNDVKAIVLGGSQFLFAAYNVLQDEAASEKLAPTFGQIFSQNLVKLLDEIYSAAWPTVSASAAHAEKVEVAAVSNAQR